MSSDEILRWFDVEGSTIYLRRVDERFVLSSADAQVELTVDEAAEILNLPPEPFRSLDRLGVDLGQDSPGRPPFQNRLSLMSQLPQDELLALVDTTTLMGAHLCLSGDVVSPLCLLELSTLTFALLCFDHIVVQPTFLAALPSMPEELGAILPLVYPPDFIPQTLWSLCAGIHGRAGSEVDAAEYAQAWAQALQVEDVHLDLRAYDRYQDSPFAWNGVFAHGYIGDLFSASSSTTTAEARRVRNEFLSIQTMRTLFNDRIAGYIQLPYLASSSRAPIQGLLLRRKAERQLLADRLLASLGPSKIEPGQDELGPYAAEISAPFLLGLILEQMNSPDDYWTVVSSYRTQFGALRRRIVRERTDWEGRPGAYLRKLLEPLAELNPLYTRSVDASAVVAGAVATAIRPDLAAAGVGVKLARLVFPAERVRMKYYKRFRPELHLLFSVAREAESLRAVEDRIGHIWGKTWQASERETLMRLAAMQPPDFSRLRSLA